MQTKFQLFFVKMLQYYVLHSFPPPDCSSDEGNVFVIDAHLKQQVSGSSSKHHPQGSTRRTTELNRVRMTSHNLRYPNHRCNMTIIMWLESMTHILVMVVDMDYFHFSVTISLAVVFFVGFFFCGGFLIGPRTWRRE